MSISSKSNHINFKKSEDSSSHAKMHSNSNIFKSSDGTNNLGYNKMHNNNNQNFSSNYNSNQDSFQPSKPSYNNTNNLNSNINYNGESKSNDSKNIKKNLAVNNNHIKELQSLGDYQNQEEELDEDNIENHPNYNQMNDGENEQENEMENQYEDGNEQYDYANHTDSKDSNRKKMDMNNIYKNKGNNHDNIMIQNEYINRNNPQIRSKESQKSLGSRSDNKGLKRPSTASIRASSSNKITNNSNKKNVYNNNINSKGNQNSNFNDNNNPKRVNSSKQKIGKNIHVNNKNNASKSDMSMSSIHSISHNSKKQINNYADNKNYKSNNVKNIQKNNRINNNHMIDNQVQHYEEENENAYIQMYDENGQLISQYQGGEDEIIEENEAEEFANDENLKEDILKEFKRVYGNKVDKMLLRSQLQQSTNILELILQNVKLARNKMVKLASSNHDPDDLAVKYNPKNILYLIFNMPLIILNTLLSIFNIFNFRRKNFS
jgi:hypothetical protein